MLSGGDEVGGDGGGGGGGGSGVLGICLPVNVWFCESAPNCPQIRGIALLGKHQRKASEWSTSKHPPAVANIVGFTVANASLFCLLKLLVLDVFAIKQNVLATGL